MLQLFLTYFIYFFFFFFFFFLLLLFCFSPVLCARSILMFRKPKFSNRKSFKTSLSFHDSFAYSLTPSKRRLFIRDRSLRSRSLFFNLLLLFSKFLMFFCLSLSVLSSIVFIFTSIISCDASILSCTSLTSFARLSNLSLLMVICDENLSILWLATSCFSQNLYLLLKHFLENWFDGVNGYGVIWIISHLIYIFGFCSAFASCHNNKLKRKDLISNLKSVFDYFTGMPL